MPTDPSSPTASPSRLRQLLVLAIYSGGFALAICAISGILNGRPGIEKSLTKMCFPIGAAWVLLCGAGLRGLCCRQLRRGTFLAACGLALTILGTPPLRNFCLTYLESTEPVFDPNSSASLDVLVVLGGGTTQGPTRAQAGSSGDRVLYAAQLFLGGYTRSLITTGEGMSDHVGRLADPSMHTREIWQKLGIPESKIATLPGINTSQELRSVKNMPTTARSGRIGILTSAWHLPRALRLARAQGLDLIPVAADYRSVPDPYIRIVPEAAILQDLSMIQHEAMAYFLNR